ncbi:hypothetical protein V7O62_02820 [Methanolobus sp. ZRKC2]|uniref:hypothetical protein n=1 Tax=Methanolobus sp. ZRKC2 TaxID=3125783 RepID=UPI00324D08B6
MNKCIYILIIFALVTISGCLNEENEFDASVFQTHAKNTDDAIDYFIDSGKEFNAALSELEEASYQYNKNPTLETKRELNTKIRKMKSATNAFDVSMTLLDAQLTVMSTYLEENKESINESSYIGINQRLTSFRAQLDSNEEVIADAHALEFVE